MVFNGLPSMLILTSFERKPISFKRSNKSLLLRSSVFSYYNLQRDISIAYILLFLRSSTEMLGAASKLLIFCI